MDYRNLGTSGLVVSRICLGCMSYATPGDPSKPGTHAWTLDESASRPFFRRALDVGITFFDTANVYGTGSSEEILGRAMADLTKREDVVLATKVRFRMRPGPYGEGLSRKAIMTEIDASLKRLGTDYVDLYQIHRWDDATPLEETLEALSDVVKAGKARYLGASSAFAWQFQKALALQERHGWSKFITMQNHYNLLYREEEREMLPLCRDAGVGVIPWSPLARGRLARPWSDEPETDREQTDAFGKRLYGSTRDADRAVVDRVGEIAESRETSRARIALAWLLAQPGVDAPIVGATKPGHLDDAVAAVDLTLTPDEIAHLGDAYVPHPVLGLG